MKFIQFLNEAKEIPEIWYHGSNIEFNNFDLKYAITDKSIALEGPGFYLTTDKDDAERYGKYIHKIELIRKSRIKKNTDKFRMDFAIKLISEMPNKEDVLSNWDENPKKAMNMLRKAVMEFTRNVKEMINNIWYDCYKGFEKEFLKKLVEGGIDGMIVNRNDGIKHLICYNPDILKFVKE